MKPELPSLDDSFGFLLNHTGRKISQLLTAHFQPYDITTEQWTVLTRLAEQDGISLKELARRSEKDQTNLTRILDQLERKELVFRRANAADRRSLLAYITDKGRALNSVLVPIEKKVVDMMLEDLSEQDIVRFRAFLTHIANKAQKHIQDVEGKP
ncbi:MarR family winged helix-turn-helix transcriptional regulator [Paenibacillus hamazuiensis]|uniref:MarR family winged helix-turn-helix transcriptional regulator n=1 Tax=Paenibacillus hamazuiensis TaxID=2936508 RepID=UPI00200F71F0|nr:MarR family transcriptional regulator [Paenibacillus hamazuiensis]